MPRTALTPRPLVLPNFPSRTRQHPLRAFILRLEARLGLNRVTDMQALDGRVVCAWSIPVEDKGVVCVEGVLEGKSGDA